MENIFIFIIILSFSRAHPAHTFLIQPTNASDKVRNIYFFLYFTSLLQTVRQTDRQTEVVQFVADKGILSANLCESVSKCLW